MLNFIKAKINNTHISLLYMLCALLIENNIYLYYKLSSLIILQFKLFLTKKKLFENKVI